MSKINALVLSRESVRARLSYAVRVKDPWMALAARERMKEIDARIKKEFSLTCM